jgi:lysozyme family protein
VGGHAISGINSAVFPGEFEAIAALAQDERAVAVEQFYQRTFWNQCYAALESDEVAKRVFDAAVNQGPRLAVEMLQSAAGCQVDGCWGPVTVETVNAGNTERIIAAFQQQRVFRYHALVAANPALQPDLEGWLARANR